MYVKMRRMMSYTVAMAVMTAVMCSCSMDYAYVGIVRPVNVPQETAGFFDNNRLPSYNGPLNHGYPAIPGDSLCVVDFMEELRVLASDAGTLPEIDFEKYTLIVGYVSFLSPGFSLEDQYIPSDENGLTLVVQYKYYSDILYDRFDDMYVYEYYWGLYEKISSDTIAFYVKLHAVDSREE